MLDSCSSLVFLHLSSIFFFFQYIAYLLDRKGDGSYSCYINEAYEGQMNTIDVIHNVVNFGEFSCVFT